LDASTNTGLFTNKILTHSFPPPHSVAYSDEGISVKVGILGQIGATKRHPPL
jgi:hypothetical protein